MCFSIQVFINVLDLQSESILLRPGKAQFAIFNFKSWKHTGSYNNVRFKMI